MPPWSLLSACHVIPANITSIKPLNPAGGRPHGREAAAVLPYLPPVSGGDIIYVSYLLNIFREHRRSTSFRGCRPCCRGWRSSRWIFWLGPGWRFPPVTKRTCRPNSQSLLSFSSALETRERRKRTCLGKDAPSCLSLLP
jgi:hypothetical protein